MEDRETLRMQKCGESKMTQIMVANLSHVTFIFGPMDFCLTECIDKMPCSSSLLNHQNLQSDARNSDGSFVCKYCSNCV